MDEPGAFASRARIKFFVIPSMLLVSKMRRWKSMALSKSRREEIPWMGSKKSRSSAVQTKRLS